MSYYSSSFGTPKEGLTRFLKVESMSYNDISGGEDRRLFPFIYNNGQLDISYESNNFKETMVDVTEQDPDGEPQTAVRIIGGPRLVTSIGPNFKNYIRAWRDGSIDENSPIEVYIQAQVIRVQEAGYQVNSIQDEVVSFSSMLPSGDNFVTGSAGDRYRATFVFKTPLVLTILVEGIKRYITLKTKFDQE